MDETKITATRGQVKHMHDLIISISKRSREQERDIKNLMSLFHFCLGVGVRSPEYEREDRQYELKTVL